MKPIVYLLDDDATVLAILQRTLESSGFEVYSSELWSDIGRRLRADRNRPATLVSDVNLPGIRGEEFCRTVLNYQKNVRVILYSGQTHDEVRTVAERLGVPFVLKREGAARVLEVVASVTASETPRTPAPAPVPAPAPPLPVVSRPPARRIHVLGKLVHPVAIQGTVTIGRDPGQQIVLPYPGISRKHATLRACADGSCEVTDLGSRNGTLVDGQRIARATTLARDAVVTIGPFELEVHFGLSDADANKLSCQRLEAAEHITITANELEPLLFFVAATGRSGTLSFVTDDLANTSDFGTIDLAGDRLVGAQWLDWSGAEAARRLLAQPEAAITFLRARVPTAPAEAPRLLDLLEAARGTHPPAAGSSRGTTSMPSWPGADRPREGRAGL